MTPVTEAATARVAAKPRAGVPQPNFFLVGAAKSGSTSLAEYLGQHPEIFMSGGDDFSTKEPMHFCEPIPPWQEKYRDFDTYLTLFANAGNAKAIGEASVAYLAWPGAAERIRARYPDARIIIVLRNPADRVYSWYTFLCQLGLEPGPSLERALEDEERRAANEDLFRESWYWHGALLYFRFGRYADDLARVYSCFPKEQVHVLLSEDLKARPQETTSAVYRFLGVDPGFTPTFEVYNATSVPFSVRFQYFLRRQLRADPVMNQQVSLRRLDYVLVWLGVINNWLGRFRNRRFNPATRRDLLTRYRDDIRRTEQLIGRSLDVWLDAK